MMEVLPCLALGWTLQHCLLIAKCRNDFRRGQKMFFELVARSLSGKESEVRLQADSRGCVCDEPLRVLGQEARN
jgi:hypothetical protein